MTRLIRGFLLVLLAVFLVGLLLNAMFSRHGVVLIQNNSSQEIKSAHVEIGRQQFRLNGIPAGGVMAALYKVTEETHYVVSVELASGKILEMEAGYVHGGSDSIDSFVVLADKLLYQPQVVPVPLGE